MRMNASVRIRKRDHGSQCSVISISCGRALVRLFTLPARLAGCRVSEHKTHELALAERPEPVRELSDLLARTLKEEDLDAVVARVAVHERLHDLAELMADLADPSLEPLRIDEGQR